MRKVILNLAVTLDGFIEGPNGEIDWCITDDGPGSEEGITSHFDQFLARIDTIFYGRISYDLWGQYQPAGDAAPSEKKLWESVHSKSKYVFSTHPKENRDVTYITSDIANRVNEIKSEPGKDIWLYGGGSLITSFMNLGLIDNYLLAVHPVILGGGKPLFADLKDRTNLKLKGTVTSKSGVILLDYEKA
jgi:dihydrofolate reductase